MGGVLSHPGGFWYGDGGENTLRGVWCGSGRYNGRVGRKEEAHSSHLAFTITEIVKVKEIWLSSVQIHRRVVVSKQPHMHRRNQIFPKSAFASKTGKRVDSVPYFR